MDEPSEDETVTVNEARRLLGCTRSRVYQLIEMGRIRVAEGGRRGRGRESLLVREDVERERRRRTEMLQERLRRTLGS